MALWQLSFGSDGMIRDKVQTAIKRIQAFEPEDGYYLAFSGGKDSQCIYHLAKMAGVKFDAHYAVTSVDPPELVQFIKKNYPDAWENRTRQYDKDGKPITMWSLIAEHTIPPTRRSRYCCAALKEPGGAGRVVMTGVRWAESANRARSHGVADVKGKPKKTKALAEQMGASWSENKFGEVILNSDNDEDRKLVEHCFRKQKTSVNPIIDWSEDDVWQFLNENGIEHCSLYDEGYTRLGCICCPLSGSENMRRDLERWPKYKAMYIRAFQKMIDNHPGEIKLFKRIDTPEHIGGGNRRMVDESWKKMIAADTPCFDGGLKWEPCDDDSKYGEPLLERFEWLSGDMTTPPPFGIVISGKYTQDELTNAWKRTEI